MRRLDDYWAYCKRQAIPYIECYPALTGYASVIVNLFPCSQALTQQGVTHLLAMFLRAGEGRQRKKA